MDIKLPTEKSIQDGIVRLAESLDRKECWQILTYKND